MTRFVSVEYGCLSVLTKTERCPRCNRHTGRERATFSVSAEDKPVNRYVLLATPDGFYICSKRFRDLAEAHGFTGVAFVPLENGYFVLKVARRVAYDLTKAYINQED